MSNEVAVNGMTVEIVDGAPTPVLGIITILSGSSVINKNFGNGVYLDGCQVQISNITSPDGGATTPDPVPVIGRLRASITQVKENWTLLLVTGDENIGLLNANPIIPGGPPVVYPVTFKIKITDANNTTLRAY